MARQRATRALVSAESTTQSAPENRQIAEGAFLSGTEPNSDVNAGAIAALIVRNR
jgi:hypothetical protein